MHRLYNFGYICLKGIEPMASPRPRLEANFPDKPTIVFRDSNLGKIDFMGCDLTKFTIEFENSRITDALVLGGKFSADIILPKDSTENIAEQKRLFMGQLKKVFEGKGDTLTSTYFHSEDMNAYNQSFMWNKNLLARSNFEKINLRLNWISSNHGYSVRRASMSTVAVILIGYFLYCIALGVYPSLEKGSWREFGIVMSFTFEFMNPVHKSGIIPEGLGILKNDNGWARSIEGLSRLSASNKL